VNSSPDSLTPERQFFLEPASPAQRQYEALRAYFVEGASSPDVSERFGYTAGSFRVLCHHFRRTKPEFFRALKHGPHTQPKKDAARALILGMRKQNLSIYDIERALKTKQTPLSTTAIWEILHEEGFARLPRRQDAERPATLQPTAAAVAVDGGEKRGHFGGEVVPARASFELSLSVFSATFLQNGPEQSRARRCWARRSEPLTARTILG
jgi:transposase